MTHTLHRVGTVEDLSNDFVILAIASQTVNAAGKAGAFKDFFRIALEYDPVLYGDMRTGNSLAADKQELLDGVQDNSIAHAVFTDAETVTKVLRALKEAELGLSIVVSGLFDSVHKCTCQAGLDVHTIEHSLGILGKTELLPEQRVLSITTMCGHGMIAFELVEQMANAVRRGRLTAKAAAEELGRQCQCGIFNTARAEQLIQAMVG